jgi:hypothetical protein
LARLVTEQETKPAAMPDPSPQWGPTTTVNDAITAWKANGWSDLSPNTASDYETVRSEERRPIRIASWGHRRSDP